VSGSLAGLTACLSAALLWAIALSLFRRPIEKYGAPTINLAKCLVAAFMQGLTVWALGLGDTLRSAPAGGIALLAASGLVGLTLGDTALFGAVTRIGVHRTLLLQTLSPLFAAIIAYLWLGERTTLQQAAVGLGDDQAAEEWGRQALEQQPASHMVESSQEQLEKLHSLLSRINAKLA